MSSLDLRSRISRPAFFTSSTSLVKRLPMNTRVEACGTRFTLKRGVEAIAGPKVWYFVQATGLGQRAAPGYPARCSSYHIPAGRSQSAIDSA